MPIVAKSVLEERRKAEAERQRLAQLAQTPPAVEQPENEQPPKRRRGVARKGEDDKWVPGDDYDVGFAKPPGRTRFREGGPPGPGRPKGLRNHDTILKRELDKKRKVRVDGKERSISTRELIVMTMVKDAVEGKDRNARKHALAEMQRLYPGEVAATMSAVELNASDALSLAEYEAELREQLRQEILRELGGDDGERLQ